MRFFFTALSVLYCLSLASGAAAQNSSDWVADSIERVFQRFDEVQEPAFTDDFILADVKLDPEYPRRFDEFSGDISGRFIGAVAMASRGEEDDARLQQLMEKILPCQREDGRFGDASLSFDAADIGPDQMALLWGNGRLLVGLLEYALHFPEEKAVIEAAVKLGDFLLKVFDECATEEVMARVRGKAANGFICFTQFNEGLELLARATGNEHYRDSAKKMEALLEPRGVQHTHGYLTTLRGHMMIYESTGDPALLAAVEARFADMEASGSILITGGLLEFFKEDYDRDEGCTEADFLRLCLQLWRATGKEQYLARAEQCLNNIFYANQFETGDFGHRFFNNQGYIPHPGAGRAWWCCTMHGLRALQDLHDYDITPVEKDGKKGLYIALWQETACEEGDFQAKVERVILPEKAYMLAFQIEVIEAPQDTRILSLRVPGWAKDLSATVSLDGETMGDTISRQPSAEAASQLISRSAGSLDLERVWQAGERVTVGIECAMRFADRQGQVHLLDGLPESGAEERAIFFGPWLLGVDAHRNPMFHGEPYSRNILLLPKDQEELRKHVSMHSDLPGSVQAPEVTLSYIHDGFPDRCTATLQPVAAQNARPQTTVSYWHWMRRQ